MASATDIITYIGVPLAVLGVLPILYNTFATLVSLSQIKRMLRHGGLTAMTRSDVVNRVIEIELPRYAVMPLDRFRDRPEYWNVSNNRSSIPGGSWTTFNWRTNVIGLKTQRVEYADQVRQPQVDVAFDELVCYLLDLGAVPDPRGWKLLRGTGLWTPVGCALMMSPNGSEKALSIAPSDDSDGNLSLAVAWSSAWTQRDSSHLPPYWVRLPPNPKVIEALNKEAEDAANNSAAADSKADDKPGTVNATSATAEPSEVDSVAADVNANKTRSITCQVLVSGLVAAFSETEQDSENLPDPLYIEHLRVRTGATAGVWFASAVTAYGTTNQTLLWNYKIPDDILHFARRETFPCGVLVLLDMVPENETPEWATKHNDYGASLDRFARQSRERHAAVTAEARMNPAERDRAIADRLRREGEQRMKEVMEQSRLARQQRDQREMEALQSPKWDVKLVAQHSLKWLIRQKTWDESFALKDIVGFMLHQMVLDGEYAGRIFKVLDQWKAWADMGGMKMVDYRDIQKNRSDFAHAALFLALIKDTSTALDSTVAMDLQECLQLWKKVRLG